jgi:ketosteroid isomerase-like protein
LSIRSGGHHEAPEALALAYLDAFAAKDFARLDALLAPELQFVGPARSFTGARELRAALQRISAVHVRNDVKRVFSDGDEVCVIYDLVTDAVGAVPTIEWIKVVDGRIASIQLFYDQLRWMKVREEMERRAAMATA